jgi:hypothetical protein
MYGSTNYLYKSSIGTICATFVNREGYLVSRQIKFDE